LPLNDFLGLNPARRMKTHSLIGPNIPDPKNGEKGVKSGMFTRISRSLRKTLK
jgi:hypothetical protein